MTTEDHANAAASGALAPISQSGQALQFGGSTAIHPESFRGRERRGYKARSGGRNRAHRGRLQRRVAGVGKNMCFCEKNPPFCDRFFGATATANGSYGRKVRENSVGSFWKTNPNMGVKQVHLPRTNPFFGLWWVRLPRSASKANPKWEVKRSGKPTVRQCVRSGPEKDFGVRVRRTAEQAGSARNPSGFASDNPATAQIEEKEKMT